MKIAARVWTVRFDVIVAIALVFCALPGSARAQTEDVERANALYNEAVGLVSEQTVTALSSAEKKFGESRSIYREAGEKTGEAKSLVGLGFVSDGLGRPEAALGYYKEALEIFSILKNDYWSARTLNNMARIYDDTGRPFEALELFNRALPLRRSAKDLNGEAVTLNSLGAVYAKTGEYQKSLGFYRQAYSLRTSRDSENDRANKRGIAIILNNIGRVYDELGDHRKAREYLLRALPLRKAISDRSGEATTLNNLGLVETDLGNLDAALGFYDRSLRLLRELGNRFREAIVLNNIAVVHIGRGDADPALSNLKTALENYRSYGDRGGEATTLNNIGLAENLKGKKNAPATMNEALLLARQTGEKSLEAITLSNLMHVWSGSGNPRLAAFYGKQSVNKYQDIRRAIHTLDAETRRGYLNSVTRTYRTLADILIELGQFAQAKQVLNMLKEEEYYDFVQRSSDEIKNLGSRVALTDRERDLIERYRKVADRVTELSREFVDLDNRKRRAIRQGERLDDESETRYDELSRQISNANAAFRLFVSKQLIDELGKARVREIEYDRSLQAKLRKWGSGTVAIYTVVTEDRYRVVLTTPVVQKSARTDIKSKDLNKKVFEFREALQDLSVDPRVKGKELYDILLKPIEKDLRAAGAKTLVWSLDGTLRYIPLAALSPDGKSYLIEQYENTIVTAKTRDDLDGGSASWRALGLGVSKSSTIKNPLNPDDVIEFSAIPGSVTELRSIVRDGDAPAEKGLFEGKRLVDEEFTRAAFEESLAMETEDGLPQYSVVHLATHFRLGTNWRDSFLLLGNGQLLTLEEISSSPAITFGDIELVTLSACDTAFATDANGKEIDSLAEAIQTKSGRSVLATLWAVIDESTPLLMTEFYRLRQMDPKTTKAGALKSVQEGFVTGRLKPDREYIERLAKAFPGAGGKLPPGKFRFDKERPFAHPYFWSPFVLIGNWR